MAIEVRIPTILRTYTDGQKAVEGKGETKPIEPNKRKDGGDNPYGREKNRRVEIIVET